MNQGQPSGALQFLLTRQLILVNHFAEQYPDALDGGFILLHERGD